MLAGTNADKIPSSALASSVGVIGSITLDAPAATIGFSNIPQTYRHLRLVLTANTDEPSVSCGLYLTCNGDTGTNYQYAHEYVWKFSDGSVARIYQNSYNDTAIFVGEFAAPSKHRSFAALDIYDYSLAAATNVQYHNFMSTGSSGQYNRIGAGIYNPTVAVTSLICDGRFGPYVAGSRATLYGIS